MKTGQIIRIISNQYTVRTQEGEQLECVAMGKLRKGHSPVVGDRVEVERFDAQNGIQRILPRRNALRRPLIANVDQAIIVMSTLCPDFSAQLVDRLIFQICYEGITPLICVTKMDLIDAGSAIHAQIEELPAERLRGVRLRRRGRAGCTARRDEGKGVGAVRPVRRRQELAAQPHRSGLSAAHPGDQQGAGQRPSYDPAL